MGRTEYWIRPGQGKAIALIHGIGANDPQAYWQDFLSVLMNDEQLHEFGVFVWKYPTHVQPGGIRNALSTMKRKTLRETAPRIALLGSAWNTTYHTQFQGYQDVVLVCHSMGGLVIKSWILQTLEQGQSTSLATLRHIAFYATPHQGAPVTTLARWNQQLKDMQLDSLFIEDVDRRWHDHVIAWKERLPGPADAHFNSYIPHLVLAGLNDGVVPPQSATIRGMPLTQIIGDHSQVIQPIDSTDTRYRVWCTHLDETFSRIAPKIDVSSPPEQHMSHTILEEKNRRESQPVIQGRVREHPHTVILPFDSTVHRPIPASLSQPPSVSSRVPSTEGQNAISVFISSVPKDEDLLQQLEAHLSTIKRQGLISLWSKRQIVPGTDWAREIDQRIEQASIILLLVSADFLASEYCDQVEVKRALERHEAGQAQVIPILLRPVDWKGALFGHLQPLPSDEKAITTWRNRDEAWKDVAEGIKKVLEELQKNEEKKDGHTPQEQQPGQAQKKLDRFPPIWNVPYRYTAFFTGRDDVLATLFTNFTTVPATGITPVQALTGFGGLGKTQTAVAYAFRYRKQYQSVLWIKAETEGDLVASFTRMAKLLALPGTNLHQRESVLDSIQKWLSNTADWLLILDNADDLALVAPFLPIRLPNGHLLLTTRATAMDGLAQSLPLTSLEPEDGALCILRRANYIGWNADLRDPSLSAPARKAALDLSELMGGLPLALEQAGAYIDTTGRGVNGYLKLYEQYRPEIQKNQYGTILYYRTAVAFAWNIAREVVQLESPAPIELLYLCAFLAPDAIPYQLFPEDPSILGSILGPVAANSLALDQALIPLRKHPLIKHEVDRDTDIPQIFIHRVLQEILRDGMDPATQRLWAERAVRIVALALPVVEWQIMQAHARSCMPLIEHWQMTIPEAILIRHRFATEHE